MKKIFQSALLLTAFASLGFTANAELADGDMLFGSYDRTVPEDSWGVNDDYTYTYDVAYFIPGDLCGGRTLKGVSVPFRNTDGITGMKAWASIDLEPVDFAPDLRTKDFTFSTDKLAFADVIFDEPVTVPSGGLYIGYSFTLEKSETFDQKNPVVISTPIMQGDEMLMFHVAGIPWMDYTSNSAGTEFLTAGIMAIFGDTKEKDQASVDVPDETYVRDVTNISLPFVIRNAGWNGVSSVDYTLDIDGIIYEGKIQFDENDLIRSGRQFWVPSGITVPVTGSYEPGMYPFTFEVTKVNGQENIHNARSVTGKLRLMADMPVRNPVIEEGTSVKCGYCPRGFYEVEVTNRLQPEAITIVYHTAQMGYSDPMIAIESAPWANGGLPTLTLDRALNPESAADKVSGGLIPAWNERRKVFSPAAVKVDVDWLDDNKTQIGVDTEVSFADAVSNGSYRLEFALLADDLYDQAGSNPAWKQTNYYSGERNLFTEDEWRVFSNGEDPVAGLHFNNVFVLGGTETMSGIPNSVPKDIPAGTSVKYTHVFDTTKALRITETGERKGSLIQDKDKLRVVAMLFDSKGQIVNAAKGWVPGYSGPLPPSESGVEDVIDDTDIYPVAYYDLTGREVKNPGNGIYIVRMSSGRTVKKVIF